MFGVIAYLYRDVLPRNRWFLIAGICSLVLAANLPIEPLYRKLVTDLLFPPIIAYAVFHVAFSNNIKLQHVARWGDFSYGTYLYAFPIQLVLLASFATKIAFPIYVAISMALALTAGVVSWHLIERWFLPLRRLGSSRHNSPTQLRPSRGVYDEARNVVSKP